MEHGVALGWEGTKDTIGTRIVIFGNHCVAVDYIGSAVMGSMPERFGYLDRAEEIGLGATKDIKVVGKKVGDVMIMYAETSPPCL